jgi:hypothetical protein
MDIPPLSTFRARIWRPSHLKKYRKTVWRKPADEQMI